MEAPREVCANARNIRAPLRAGKRVFAGDATFSWMPLAFASYWV
ncbi:MAG: hypothetical protein U1F31_01670 [Steroidobacteraceae bacterium]|jgi:hypothetical protein